MGLLERLSFSNIASWLGVPQVERESLRDIIFDPLENGPKLRDSELLVKPVVETNDERLMGEAESLGINPDLQIAEIDAAGYAKFEVRPSDVAKTDLPRFWRYVRPKQAIKKMDGEFSIGVAPKGGVGFYVELDAANKTFAFSYALCHNNDNFDYSLARLITKGRFEDEVWFEVSNYDEKIGVVENIKIALDNFLNKGNNAELGTAYFSSTPEKDKISLLELNELFERI